MGRRQAPLAGHPHCLRGLRDGLRGLVPWLATSFAQGGQVAGARLAPPGAKVMKPGSNLPQIITHRSRCPRPTRIGVAASSRNGAGMPVWHVARPRSRFGARERGPPLPGLRPRSRPPAARVRRAIRERPGSPQRSLRSGWHRSRRSRCPGPSATPASRQPSPPAATEAGWRSGCPSCCGRRSSRRADP